MAIIRNLFKEAFQDSIKLKSELIEEEEEFIKLANINKGIKDIILDGNKLLICGNGGSAADAQHLAAELVVRLSKNCNREPIQAYSIVPDSVCLTACANDYDFENIFERPLTAIGNKGDALLLISTSGNSKNLLFAANCAKRLNIKTFALLGGDGGDLAELVDYSYIVKSNNTARIQEVHILIEHILAEFIERSVLDNIKVKYPIK
tara:strand:+ start:615 stop:1232 length:618 start_codon:yes stop_codon:yes gene_type:complete